MPEFGSRPQRNRRRRSVGGHCEERTRSSAAAGRRWASSIDWRGSRSGSSDSTTGSSASTSGSPASWLPVTGSGDESRTSAICTTGWRAGGRAERPSKGMWGLWTSTRASGTTPTTVAGLPRPRPPVYRRGMRDRAGEVSTGLSRAGRLRDSLAAERSSGLEDRRAMWRMRWRASPTSGSRPPRSPSSTSASSPSGSASEAAQLPVPLQSRPVPARVQAALSFDLRDPAAAAET